MGKKQFYFFQTAETGNRTLDSGVKGSGANHYPRAPALWTLDILCTSDFGFWTSGFEQKYLVLQTLNIIQTVFGQTLDIKLWISSDFVHQTSDCGL